MKRFRPLICLCIIVGALLACGESSTTSTTNSTNSSSAPAKQGTWTTTHTFSGNGIKKTETITVPNDWKLQWSCTPSSFMGGSYNVIVGVYNSDSTPADITAINAMCKAGNTSGETEERTSGNVYLDVNSEGDWSLTVQEMK